MTSLHIKSSSSFTFFSGILHHYYSSTTTFSVVLPLRKSKRWGNYCCDDARCENICCGCRWGTRGASGVVVVCSKMIIGLYFRTYSKLEAELLNTCKNIRKRVTNIDFANIKRCACIEWKSQTLLHGYVYMVVSFSFIKDSLESIYTHVHTKKRENVFVSLLLIMIVIISMWFPHHPLKFEKLLSVLPFFYTNKYSSQSTYASFA